MLTALEYLGSVGIGVTSPQLFRADDDQIYIVKLQNNRMGTKVLVNEYLACWFGQQMNLCFPASGLIQISEQVLKKNRRLGGAVISSSVHFASQYIPSNSYVTRQHLRKAVNKQAMAGVMLFDHLFHNVDRAKNRKNLLICNKDATYILYAIDNSHLFIRGRWTVSSLAHLVDRMTVNRVRVYGWLLRNFLIPEDFTPYVTAVKEITNESLHGLVASIPEEWLPNRDERNALLQYMVVRCEMVDSIVQKIYRSLSNMNRRTYFH